MRNPLQRIRRLSRKNAMRQHSTGGATSKPFSEAFQNFHKNDDTQSLTPG
jgi:hypothetical protein